MASEVETTVEGSGGVPAVTPGVVGEGTLAETPEEHKVFPPFDATTFTSQLFWFLITFIIFYFIMAKVAIPRLSAIVEGRRGKIAGDLAEAEGLKKQSEEAGVAYEKALADARGRASGIAETARGTAKAATDKQRSSVEADLAAKLAKAESDIAGIKEKALKEVKGIAEDTTGAVVQALSGVEATAAEVSNAVSAAFAEKTANA